MFFAAAIVAVVWMPIVLHITAKARGEWGKTWVVASGFEWLWLTISIATATGIDSVLQIHLAGRKILHRSPIFRRKDHLPSEALEAEPVKPLTLEDLKQLRARIERWFALEDLLRLVVGLRRHVKISKLEAKLIYSTPDVALTGVISGALYTLAGLLSPFGRFMVEPDWDAVARGDGNIDTTFRLYPGRAVCAVVWFVIRKIRLRKPATERVATPSPLKKLEGNHAR
jgi:hypothetical protein